MRILVTGVGGFAGSHLADALLKVSEAEVWGVLLTGNSPPYLDSRARTVVANLNNPAEVQAVLAAIRPEQIYHLAGQAYVPQSWADPWETLETNLRGQLNLFQGCLRLGLVETRILVIGSNEAYGRLQPNELPATEEAPFRPDSPYGVSKLAQDFLGLSYFISHKLPIVRARPFNHIGPRQNANRLAGKVSR